MKKDSLKVFVGVYLSFVFLFGLLVVMLWRELGSLEQGMVRQMASAGILRLERFFQAQNLAMDTLGSSVVLADESSTVEDKRRFVRLAERVSPTIYYILVVDVDGQMVVGSNRIFDEKLVQKDFSSTDWFKRIKVDGKKPFFLFSNIGNSRVSSKVFPEGRKWTFTATTSIRNQEEKIIGYAHVVYDWEALLETTLLSASRREFLFTREGRLIGSTADRVKGKYSVEGGLGGVVSGFDFGTQEGRIRVVKNGLRDVGYKGTVGIVDLSEKYGNEPDWYFVVVNSLDQIEYLWLRVALLVGAFGILMGVSGWLWITDISLRVKSKVLLVIILSGLLVLLWLGLDPVRWLASVRNYRRRLEAERIVESVNEYRERYGELPEGMDDKERQIGDCVGSGNLVCEQAEQKCVSLQGVMNEVPVDEFEGGSLNRTNYSVKVNERGLVSVRACGAELGAKIVVVR